MFLTIDFIYTFFHMTQLQQLQGRVQWWEGCSKERSRVEMTLPLVLIFLSFLSYFLSASFSSVYSCFPCITCGNGAESYCIINLPSEALSRGLEGLEPWIRRRNNPSSHGEGPSEALSEWLTFGVLLLSLSCSPWDLAFCCSCEALCRHFTAPSDYHLSRFSTGPINLKSKRSASSVLGEAVEVACIHDSVI